MDPEDMLCDLNRAIATRQIAQADRERLRALARAGVAAAFNAELAKVLASAEEHARGTEPDCFEANAGNPALPMFMRACKITAADIREHGPRGALASRNGAIVPNLADLITATAQRGG